MQIALQDFRKWGYSKIKRFMHGTYHIDMSDLMESLVKYNSIYYELDNTAYSFPDSFAKMQDSLDTVYDGMEILVYSIEPFIGTGKVDNTCKRKFRDTWFKVWNDFGSDLGLSKSEVGLLCDFGIRLAYAIGRDRSIALDKDIQIILYFYNIVLKWSLFTSNLINFDRNDTTFKEVLDKLIIDDTSSFVDDFIYNLK